ncbi:right-handed parallel beta-helix repeat-containing protein [Methanogenium marinum]|uniref:Right-handed parallel beta-helix repeat-containing protein n=1 Tax=Methanogenium marinum TaxID=348610 RepID=A0A9Q4PXB5_9EURY|nr:right-handed parallel beta-helix repeat-containing protein [Methanogenium marinum]MDE4908441.1 right-handed parallel beta-helix repeat-containing protein [Methanogenium marinum]
MVSKTWAGTLSVLTIIIAVLCLAAPAMATTWVVNPDGTGDFTTIQTALDSEWTSGDTIEIEYAIYKEPVAVDADGGGLTITGVPSPAGDLPVIDGMNGAIELPGLVDGFLGCGECSMFLYNGDFAVSSLCVTNASRNGLVVNPSGDENTVSLTDIEAADNGNHGVNVLWCDKVVLSGIEAYNNGRHGINVYSDSLEGTDLLCTDNGRHGLSVWAGDVSLTYVDAFQNGYRGVSVHTWCDACPATLLTGIYVADNGWDGLFVEGSGPSDAEISRIESTGNGGDGVVLKGFDDFTASDLFLDGNGVGEALTSILLADGESGMSLSCADSVNGVSLCNKMDRNNDFLFSADVDAAATENVDVVNSGIFCDLRGEGNGLFVMNSGNGTIENVDATNNPSVGILVDATGDVVISDCTADENGYLGILTASMSDESEQLLGQVLSDTGMDTESAETKAVIETAFTRMSASVADATVVSEDEFILWENVSILIGDVFEEGPDVTLSSVEANNNGYAGIGVIASYINATDISADENGASPTDVVGTLSGAGIVGASFVGEFSDIAAADNGGAGMAAASLALYIDDATFTGNGAEAYSDTHGPHFQTGLLTVSLVNFFSGVQSDENAGSGILMTSVITLCDECSASGNAYGGIVAADPLSLGIAAVLVHGGLDSIMDTTALSEEDRFYLESLSTPAMQDVVTCYGTTDAVLPSSVSGIDLDNITEDDVAFIIDVLHQYMATTGCYMMNSAADENGLFGMAVVSPNVITNGFSADGNGYDGGSPLLAIAGTGIVGLYLNGDFMETSVSENTGAGMVTVGVVSEYDGVIADDNGYAGIVTIDPVTLAAAALGAYFVVLDDTGAQVTMAAEDSAETTDLEMHADIAESAVVQEIVSTYYTGTSSVDATIDGVSIPEDGMDILLEHIELYFENAGVYAYDVSASGNGYPGFVAIAPNVVMDGVTADDNGAANDDESGIISLAAGSGVIGLSIVGDYEDIAASGNTGAGIATAGVVTDMTACDADENGVGVVSLFIVGDCTEIMADENAGPGIVLAGINGTLTDSVAIENAGPGIVCVDPVATVLMYLVPVMSAGADDAETVSPETLALLCQLSGSTNSVSSVSGDVETETKTAWTLIEWAVEHVSSYEGDITELNETEILDLVLTHYLTNAGMSVSDVSVDNNGWQGVVILSPSVVIEDVAAEGNGYHGVSVISPWKAVDAFGWVHPAEPVGAERLSVRGIYAVSNEGAGLAVAGANGGDVMDVYGSDNYVGILLADSDNLMVSDTMFETNWAASVLCGGSKFNSLTPIGPVMPDGALTDLTGSCNNAFVGTAVDGGIVVYPNSSGNVFDNTFFDEAAEIAADISGDGPFVLYSTSGYWAPVLPDPQRLAHMGGCGIGVSGLGGFNTTVNITYDYSYGYSEVEGEALYPQWAVNSTTPWEYWGFNTVTNDKSAKTVGTMVVPITPSASVPYGEFTDLMFIAPFWVEEQSSDDPGHDIFMKSLSENDEAGYIGPDGVFIPYTTPDAPVGEIGDGTGDGAGDGTGDDTGDDSGDDTGAPQQSGADGDGSASGQAGAPGVTATATAVATTPVPTTTPAGVVPVIGALGILGALAVIRRR